MKPNKSILLAFGSISLIYFSLFIFPNAAGSQDQNMLSVFEPDEFAQYPHVIRMLKWDGPFKENLRRFTAYQHYYYGYPFYFLSALTILPIKIFSGDLTSTMLVMVALRQLISVTPMLLAILILVYLQTGFEKPALSLGLFIFLLTIPAVVKNNLWWHPDSLTFLFIALTFLFLHRDNSQFNNNFYYAAITCGLATGTKLIGLFFLLTIPTYILVGFLQKHLTLRGAFIKGIQFLALMGFTFLASNPLLLTSSGREAYLKIQQKQAEAMSFGWHVKYDSGLSSWLTVIQKYYSPLYLIILALGGMALNIWRYSKRMLNINILIWALPFSLHLLFNISIKPFHFFLPILLPVFSCLASTFPDSIQKYTGNIKADTRFGYVVLLIVGAQFAQNLIWDINLYSEKLYRDKNSDAISFYRHLDQNYLSNIPQDKKLTAYRDVYMYVPNDSQIDATVKWGLVNYEFVNKNQFDLIFIWNQRIYDYTQEGVLEKAAEPDEMKETIRFYNDVKHASLNGYVLLFQDQFGSAFIREDLYKLYYQP